jgi:hypothetical protein
MRDNDVTAGRVVAVLLADGWHRIVRGSFSVGRLGFGTGADLGAPGFRFEEADAGTPYQPTVLAGPLESIIAVRQVTTTVSHLSDVDRARGSASRSAGGSSRTVAGSYRPLSGGATRAAP